MQAPTANLFDTENPVKAAPSAQQSDAAAKPNTSAYSGIKKNGLYDSWRRMADREEASESELA